MRKEEKTSYARTKGWKVLAAGIGCLMLGTATGNLHAQIDEKLAGLGMENIRMAQTDGHTTVAFENRAYRSSYEAVGKAVETALEAMEEVQDLTLTDKTEYPN